MPPTHAPLDPALAARFAAAPTIRLATSPPPATHDVDTPSRADSSVRLAQLKGLTVEAYLKECVMVEPLAIEEEFVRLPADLAYWAERYALAYGVEAKAKSHRTRLHALLSIEYRESLGQSPGVGRVTEALVEAKVENDVRYIAAVNHHIDADVDLVRLKGVVDAIRTKRDMLISIGAHVRAEMGTDPTLRRDHQAARQYASTARTGKVGAPHFPPPGDEGLSRRGPHHHHPGKRSPRTPGGQAPPGGTARCAAS